MTDLNDAEGNTQRVIQFFNNLMLKSRENGVAGFTKFRTVFDNLMPIQKEKLRSLVSDKFDELVIKGTFLSIGITYSDPIIDYINVHEGSETNYKLWNVYAKEYDRINQILNEFSRAIASNFDGIPLTATIGGIVDKVNHVHDYFEMVISHRTVAEFAGLGWRGKNQLIINEKYSCALRFASVILPFPTRYGEKLESQCGDCSACEDACSYIKYRETLPDYRENCRRYILFLKRKGIEKDVCGKCINACYRKSQLKDRFSLSEPIRD